MKPAEGARCALGDFVFLRSALCLACACLPSACAPSGNQEPHIAAATLEIALDTSRLQIRQLHPGVWLHTSIYVYPNGSIAPSNGLIVEDGDELLLIDTAWGEELTRQLIARVEWDLGRSVRRTLVTHAHGDRLAGADFLRTRGIAVLALPLTRRIAVEGGFPLPSDTLRGLPQPGRACTRCRRPIAERTA